MRILHLEDNPADSLLIERLLQDYGFSADLTRAASAEAFRREIRDRRFDAVVIDNGVPGFDGLSALRLTKEVVPTTPVIVCSGSARREDVTAALRAGASDYVDKHELWRLVPALNRAYNPADGRSIERLSRQHAAMSRLVGVLQELSFAREASAVMSIVTRAARELANADGAAFVLREEDTCFYAAEDAIAPLWTGQRFPLNASIAGWTILNARPVGVEDVLVDTRLDPDQYRNTFVKSLAIAPIRTTAPMGAIGVYWAERHVCSADELMLLEALANTTAVALENVQVYDELESRVRERTRALEAANEELEAFTYAVSHDLRSPLRALSGALSIMAEDYGSLDVGLRDRIRSAKAHVTHMYELIDDLLRLSGITRRQLKIERFDLGELAAHVVEGLRNSQPDRIVRSTIQRGVIVDADRGLMRVLMENLLSNAWKYTSIRAEAHIVFRAVTRDDSRRIFQISDNGAGFDPRHARRLFQPFQRLHSAREFSGTGVGLATVQRIVRRHDGEVWGESQGPGHGATFSFTLASYLGDEDT